MEELNIYSFFHFGDKMSLLLDLYTVPIGQEYILPSILATFSPTVQVRPHIRSITFSSYS
jgi:hypothetical protein